MYQEAMIGNFTNRFMTLSILLLAALASTAIAQTKSLETAQAQLAGFDDASEFSLEYDESRYVTIATVKVDSMADNESFKKQMKRFDWTLTSYFAVKGVDGKPVRVVLCAATQSKRFLFQRNNELTLTLDDEEILLGEAQRTSEYKGGKAKENLCWEVDIVITEEFAKVGEASFELGGISGSFSEASLLRFRHYGELVSVHG